MDGTSPAPMATALRAGSPAAPACRCCAAPLHETFADLDLTPLANSYVAPADASRMEPFYPLHALLCSDCRLVQLAEFESPQAIFSEYRYLSSVSHASLCHAETYAERMTARFGLGAQTPVVEAMRRLERECGLEGREAYRGFAEQVVETKAALLEFLLQARREGKRVVGYGAPAKGNTLLNYCGVGPELMPFTVDRSPHKQGLLLPGTRIPIRAPEAILEARPDYVLVLPWNLREEIAEQMAAIREWGGRFVVPIPRMEIF